MEFALLLSGVAAVLISLPLLLLGIRGRRVNEHPVCRACRFNLSGLAPVALACPECGASLASPRAIRVGERRRIARLVLAAVVLLGAGAFCVTAGAWKRIAALDMQSLKPFSMLSSEARSPRPIAMDSAIRELDRRWNKRRLSGQQVREVVALGLNLQSDMNGPWDPSWADLLDSLRRGGRLDPDQTTRFLRQMMGFALDVPRTVAPGAVLTPRLVVDGGRGPRNGTHRLTAQPFSFRIDDAAPVTDDETGSVRAPTMPGEYTLVAEWRLTVHDGQTDGAPIIATWTERLEGRFVVGQPIR
jgi:predicted RNA-binding Zn-ribbon protein involved in translation (DUF1610 family)